MAPYLASAVIQQSARLLPVFWGNNTQFVVGLIGRLPQEFFDSVPSTQPVIGARAGIMAELLKSGVY